MRWTPLISRASAPLSYPDGCSSYPPLLLPPVETHAQRFSQLMGDESAYLDKEATSLWTKLRGPLDSLSTQVADVEPVLGRRIVRKWLKEAGMSPDFETVEQLLQVQSPTKISVGGKVLESTCGFWWVTSEERLESTTLAPPVRPSMFRNGSMPSFGST